MVTNVTQKGRNSANLRIQKLKLANKLGLSVLFNQVCFAGSAERFLLGADMG